MPWLQFDASQLKLTLQIRLAAANQSLRRKFDLMKQLNDDMSVFVIFVYVCMYVCDSVCLCVLVRVIVCVYEKCNEIQYYN